MGIFASNMFINCYRTQKLIQAYIIEVSVASLLAISGAALVAGGAVLCHASTRIGVRAFAAASISSGIITSNHFGPQQAPAQPPVQAAVRL